MIIQNSKKIKENNEILLIFLLLRSVTIHSKKKETMKKIECLLIEKYSSIEKESISPVMPKDKIKIKLILSTLDHHVNK
tara:strand:- start:180 stop:416 length:237 start_codon:yes stop_codon:yes gene_type:complete